MDPAPPDDLRSLPAPGMEATSSHTITHPHLLHTYLMLPLAGPFPLIPYLCLTLPSPLSLAQFCWICRGTYSEDHFNVRPSPHPLTLTPHFKQNCAVQSLGAPADDVFTY